MDIRFLIEQLDEISRRGFLTGLGAAGAGYMLGKNDDDDSTEKPKTEPKVEPSKPIEPIDPWNVRTTTDSLDGTVTGQTGYVKSTDGFATLWVTYAPNQEYFSKSTSIEIKGDIINSRKYGSTGPIADGRIKFGGQTSEDIQFNIYQKYDGALIFPDNFDKIISYNGTIKIEVPLYNTGRHIFTFNVRPTKSFKSKKTQAEPNFSNLDPKTGRHKDAKPPAEQPIEEASDEAIARIVELSKDKK